MNTSEFKNTSEFELAWIDLGRRICQAIYIKPEIQRLKGSLQKKGFLSLEEKSEFIDICGQTKYDVIYKTYGLEGSSGYKKFSDGWRAWFQTKGVTSTDNRGQRNSVDHILFGSTPDPIQFLMHFEEEMLGSMK